MKERKRFAVVAWHVIGQEKAGESDRERQKESEKKRQREKKEREREKGGTAWIQLVSTGRLAQKDWFLGEEKKLFVLQFFGKE